MKRRLVMDTNAYSALMCGDKRIVAALNAALEVFVPIAVLGELYDGFRGGTRTSENIKILNAFLSKPVVKVIDATRTTAERYGEIKSMLSKSGHPVPINDVWIAAQALEHNADILTFDHHFQFMASCGVRTVAIASTHQEERGKGK